MHWLIIAVVALLVLGPDKLPDAAQRVAKIWRDFQQVRGTLLDQVRDLADEAIPAELRGHALDPEDISETADPAPLTPPEIPESPAPAEPDRSPRTGS